MTISTGEFRRLFPDIARHCDEPGIQALVASMAAHNISAGDVFIKEGEDSDALHLVQSGSLAITIKGNGSDIALDSVSAGDSFGKSNLVDPGAAATTVTASTDAVVLSLSHGAFRALEDQHLAMTSNLLRMVSDELIGMCRSADSMLFTRSTDTKSGATASGHHTGLKEWAATIYRKLHGRAGEKH